MKKYFLPLLCFASCLHAMDIDSLVLPREQWDLIKQVTTGKADSSSLNRLPGEQWGALRVHIQIPSQRQLVKVLLQAGADPNFNDGYDTPLSGAGTKDAVTLLLQYGADPQKCCKSTLSHQILSYQNAYLRNDELHRNGTLLNKTLDTMTLLLEKGESIHRYGLWQHLLFEVAQSSMLGLGSKKAFLSFLIRHGSNPNLPYCDREVGFLTAESVYEQLGSSETLDNWVPFIRKERGWYLARPLLLAAHKEQPDDCHMSSLPLEIVHIIGKMVLGHPDPIGA